jgi:hypothetical protein
VFNKKNPPPGFE